jgi:spore coat polysaccharide biosynthesis predicted glycosyltransferase SpsG
MGHTFRALQLAMALKDVGTSVGIVCNDNSFACHLMRGAGLPVYIAPTDTPAAVDWEVPLLEELRPKLWVNDRLEVSARHARIIRDRILLASIDDIGEAGSLSHIRFLSLPFTYTATSAQNTYMGVDYLILSVDFRKSGYTRQNTPNPRLLVNMGGSDTWGATVFIVTQLVTHRVAATVITGPAFSHEYPLQKLLTQNAAKYITRFSYVPDLAALFAQHDLLVCSGGLTPFEAASAGLPSIVLATEEHERYNAVYIHKKGAGILLGFRYGSFFSGELTEALILCCKKGINRMSETAAQLVDGNGIIRVRAILLEALHEQ